MILLLIFTLFLASFLFAKNKNQGNKNQLIINGHKFTIEVADNEVKRAKGLSGREKLEENSGMLFVYSQPGIYTFWMLGMKFPLDFVFINQDKVVDLVENVPPPKFLQSPRTIKAKENFDQVLEINAGMINKYKITIGQKVSRE